MRWLILGLCGWAGVALADMGGSALWLGADLDDDSGRGLRAGLDWQLAPDDLLSLGGGLTETDDDLSTGYADVRYLHDFRPLRLGLEGSWWRDEDIVTTSEITAIAGAGGEGWRVELGLGRQQADFDAIAFDFVLPIGDFELPVAGVADCEVDAGKVSALLSGYGRRWSGYLGVTRYDYDDSDCDVDSPQLDALAEAERRRLRDLGGRLVEDLGRTANAWVNRQALFLEQEVTAGMGRQFDRLYLSLDGAAGEGAFFGEDYRLLSASLSLPLGAANLLDLTLGRSELDDDDAAFVSLLFTRLL